MKKLTSIIPFLSALAVVFEFLTPAFVFAQLTAPDPIQSVPQLQQLLVCKVLAWIFTFVIIFSVIMILVAAYKYLTSGGNDEKVGEATKAITWAVVGIAVAILARGVPLIIGNFFNVGNQVDGFCP